MSKKGIFYVAFFVLLAIGFYFAASYLIPGYNDRKLEPISKVGPFTFTNQDGKPFTNNDVAGKIYVAEFFFTTCPGICPMMNDNMKQVYEKYKGNPDFLILSHTCDPKYKVADGLVAYYDNTFIYVQDIATDKKAQQLLTDVGVRNHDVNDPHSLIDSVNITKEKIYAKILFEGKEIVHDKPLQFK